MVRSPGPTGRRTFLPIIDDARGVVKGRVKGRTGPQGTKVCVLKVLVFFVRRALAGRIRTRDREPEFPTVLRPLDEVRYPHFASVTIYRKADWEEAARTAITFVRECRIPRSAAHEQ
jgi:hypothetical protein